MRIPTLAIAMVLVATTFSPTAGQAIEVGTKVFVVAEPGIAATHIDEDGDITIPFGTVLTIEESGPNRYAVRYEAKPFYVSNQDVLSMSDALEFANRQLETTPDVEWHALKTHLLYSLQRFDEAVKASELALELDAKHVKSLQYRASSFFFMNEFEQTVDIVDELLQIAPDHYLTHAINFYVLHTRGEHTAGIEAMEKSVELNPYNGPLWTNLGFAHWQIENYERCFECLEQAIEVAPAYPGCYQLYGICKYSIGEIEAAKKLLNKAAELNDKRSQTYMTLALIADSEQDHERYLELIKQAVGCEDCADYNSLTYAWEMAVSPVEERRDGQFALEVADKLIEEGQVEPETMARCLETRAAALAETGRFMEALDALELINPDSRQDRYREMKEHFEQKEKYRSEPDPTYDL